MSQDRVEDGCDRGQLDPEVVAAAPVRPLVCEPHTLLGGRQDVEHAP